MPTELRTGTVVGGFRLESLVGEGAMGAVYLAEDTTDGRRVALKVLARELARDERFRRRFLRESTLAAALDHPHVVPVVRAGEEGGELYLAMPYVDGADLRELLRAEGRLDPRRALDLVAQVADGLDAAHAAGLVHRDVKPGNVLVTADAADEHALVADFGLARHVSSVGSLTGDRGFVGTIDYVSPEQIAGGALDARADVYSLACVLFECLAGERPFERDSELAVVYAHLNEPPPRLSEARPELPRAFDDVFARGLAKSPDDRYATCGALVESARAAYAGKSVARRTQRRRRVVAGVAAVTLAVAGAVGLLASRGEEAAAASITPTSIAGAALGDSETELKRRFGLGWRKDRLETPRGYSLVIFHRQRLSTYFDGSGSGAVEITTWNRSFRTAEGVGPCSSVDDLKTAYGKRLRASPLNTQNGRVFGYVVGRTLFFAITDDLRRVGTVALYDGTGPGGLGADGALPTAAYIALGETPCG